MLVVFADKFPLRYKRRVERLVKRWAQTYNLLNGWECLVTTEVDPNNMASVDCVVQSHSIQLDLRPERLKNLRAIEADIAHELWHVLYWRTASAIQALPRRYSTVVLAAFEEDHDQASRVWLQHKFGKQRGLEA
jgi:hypothetical protein